ncbi:MAG: hypothetical protein RBG13Loki_3303 [Promethearchaeota archaeon CR_4]|nr:MAG: hypothetical protein RBG13Loki_3303 [Candidatus Lokiarchaeota archaeon CR_4]
MESFNQYVKAPFNQGNNYTKLTHLQCKLQLLLGCKIRFFEEEGREEVS